VYTRRHCASNALLAGLEYDAGRIMRRHSISEGKGSLIVVVLED
jgi:hypothetical protein